MSNRSPQHDSSSVSNVQPPTSDLEDRCTHTSADGRRCVSLTAAKGYPFCAFHALKASLPDPQEARAALKAAEARRAQMFQPPERDVTDDLLGPTEDFCSATAINLALRRLVNLLASNRISPRRAAVLAYTFQLLLQSLPEVKKEYKEFSKDHDASEVLCRDLDVNALLRDDDSCSTVSVHAEAIAPSRASAHVSD